MTPVGGNRDGEEMIRNDIGDEGDPRLQALFDALGAPDAIDPEVAARHVAMAATEAAGSSSSASGRAPWHRRFVARAASFGLTIKILAGAAAAVAATGGAAAGGILPGPVQSFVADTAAHVGLHFPNPRLVTTTTTTTTTTVTTIAGTATTTTVGDGDGDAATGHPAAGASVWNTTTCTGDPIAVHYTVTESGDLHLDAITGNPTDVDSDDDRIRVEFGDVRVDIRIDGGVVVDEDRDCTSSTTTVPGGGGGDDDDDGDDDDGDGEGDHDDDGDGDDSDDEHPAAGPHVWSNTACDGSPISVSYTVDDDGSLALGSISGETDDVDEDDDRIRVRFDDGVEVDIRVIGDALVVVTDRDCDDDESDDDD